MKPIPKTTELNETISNDINSTLGLFQNFLKKVLAAFSAVFAAKFKLSYIFLADIQDNIFADTAGLEVNGGTLERQGRIQLGRNPRPATVGVFELNITGSAGSILRTGLTFKSNESTKSPGQLYILDAEYELTGTDDVVEVRALGGGTDFDLDVADLLTITEPVIGVNQTADVATVVTQPRAQESIDVYRQQVLDAYQLEPQGGAKTDYRLWSADAQGVRKVYPYVKNGDGGTMQIYVEATVEDSLDGNGTPSTDLLTDVYDVIQFDPDETRPINERGRRPAQAGLETIAISIIPVDVNIINLQDDSSSIKAAIFDNMKSFLYDLRPYVDGADLPRNKNDILYSARLQSVVTDVLSSGNFFDDFEMLVNGVAVSSYTFNLGNIPYLRNVNYI